MYIRHIICVHRVYRVYREIYWYKTVWHSTWSRGAELGHLSLTNPVPSPAFSCVGVLLMNSHLNRMKRVLVTSQARGRSRAPSTLTASKMCTIRLLLPGGGKAVRLAIHRITTGEKTPQMEAALLRSHLPEAREEGSAIEPTIATEVRVTTESLPGRIVVAVTTTMWRTAFSDIEENVEAVFRKKGLEEDVEIGTAAQKADHARMKACPAVAIGGELIQRVV